MSLKLSSVKPMHAWNNKARGWRRQLYRLQNVPGARAIRPPADCLSQLSNGYREFVKWEPLVEGDIRDRARI